MNARLLFLNVAAFISISLVPFAAIAGPAPAITTQPLSQSVVTGSNAVFTVAASGNTPLFYLWSFNGTNLTNGAHISGATNVTLTVSNVAVADAGNYQCTVTNTHGSATSSNALLTVLVPAAISVQPTNQSVVLSNSASFSATATGTAPLNYRWYFNNAPLTDGGRISGSTTPGLGIANAQTNDAGAYQLVVTNNYGVATSAVVTLTVLVPATITMQPTNQIGLIGGTLSFSVTVSGTAPLFYQWQRNGTNLTDGQRISGSGSSTLTLSNLQMSDAGPYQLICTNNFGAATSAVASLQVTLPDALIDIDFGASTPSSKTGAAVIGQTTSDFWNSYNLDPSVVNLLAADGTPTSVGVVVGNIGPSVLSNSNPDPMFHNYLWELGFFQPLLVDVTNLPPGKYDIYYYGSRGAGESIDYELLVNGTSLGHQPLNDTGGDINSTNWQEGFHYVVFHNVSVTNFGMTLRASILQTTLQASPGISGMQIAKAYAGPTAPYFVSQPTNQTVVSGFNGSFSAGAFGSPSPNYRWFFNGAPLANSSHIAGADTFSLTITNAQAVDAGNYYLVATNASGSATSMVATLTVQLVPPTFDTQPTNQVVLVGSAVAFSSSASGSIPINYQWYFNGAPLSDGGNVSGAATAQLSISAAQTNNIGSYYVVASNNVNSATSAVATLVVHVPAKITGQPLSQSIVQSNDVTFSASVIGDAPVTYQWYFGSTPLSDNGHVNGSGTSSLTISNVQTADAGSYQLVVTNLYGSDNAVVALTVLVPAYIITQPTNRVVPVGTTASFTVLGNGTAPLNYLWYSNGVPLVNGGRFGGVTTGTLTILSSQTNDSANYYAIITNNYGAATSAVAVLTVFAPVQITGHPASQAVLLTSNVTFTVTAAGSPPLSYQWYLNGTALTDNGRISGSTAASLNIANVQTNDAGGYVAVVTNLWSSATSRVASLTPQSVLAPSVRYVSLNNTNPLSPYLTWDTAATNIQDAIDAAVNGDTVLVSNGLYQTGWRVIYGNTTNRVAVNKAVAVTSVNGPATTVIQGVTLRDASFRCVYMTNGASLSGFTLTNGGTIFTGDALREQCGAGVWCEDSSVIISNCIMVRGFAYNGGGGCYQGTIVNCVLTNNSGDHGGGAYASTLINCTLIKNTASGQAPPYTGGGAAFSSLSNCLIVGNAANSGGGAYSCTLNNCVVSNNIALNGGGMYLGTINNSLISSNRASSYGGGVYSNVVNNCTFTTNYAEWGGAGAFATLNNCFITGNKAQNYGGGIYNSTANNCLLTRNTSGSLGTAVYDGILKNCTVVSNTSPATASISAVNSSAITNSIVYDNSGGNTINTKNVAYTCTYPLPATTGNFTNPPLFVNEAAGDYRLQSNSPCINAGKNAFVAGSIDLSGNTRIVGSAVDAGAYEFQTPASTLSYAWAQQYGLPTDGSADNLDSDGDGLSNWQEWIAGTNPTNAASVLKMFAPNPTNIVSGVTVSWQSVANVIYYLDRSTNLSAQPPFSTIASNITGQVGTTSYTDTTATNPATYFYRVGVQ